jgi:drug/metabolite transporter (DMT)-like permease
VIRTFQLIIDEDLNMKFKFSGSDLLLLTTTMIWGWTFIIVKWSVAAIDPFFFIFIRFMLALLLLGILFHPKVKENWGACLKPGLFLGIILGLAFIAQTLGLKYTTASASGFITGLSVILVAVLAAFINRRLPRRIVLLGIVAATAGLLLITLKGNLVFAKGDLLTLACAVLYALHVVYTERMAQNLSASVLTLIQFSTVVIISGVCFLLFGQKPVLIGNFSILQWLAILYCGILATAVAYLFQTKAQQKIPAYRTAVLLATEPLFAGIFAIGLRFDPFDWKVVIGGGLIFVGMILAGWDNKIERNLPIPEIVPVNEN